MLHHSVLLGCVGNRNIPLNPMTLAKIFEFFGGVFSSTISSESLWLLQMIFVCTWLFTDKLLRLSIFGNILLVSIENIRLPGHYIDYSVSGIVINEVDDITMPIFSSGCPHGTSNVATDEL